MKKKSSKYRDIFELVIGFLVVVLIGYISTFYFERFDLTSEKRHTLTETTTNLMDELDDVVYIKVFLKGEFPADYQRLQQAIKEKLDEMRAYSNGNLEYQFINPSESQDKESREKMYGELIQKGLQYSSLQIRHKDGVSEKIIFPGALVAYKGREVPLQILQNKQRAADAQMVNEAINNLEYQLVNSIYMAMREEQPKVAFLTGHGELSPMETLDFANELRRYYQVEQVSIDGDLNALSRNEIGNHNRRNKYEALVIAKPDSAFSEQDKYIIDQFVMYGGKVIWLIDPMEMSLDSLQGTDMAMALPADLNLDDQLFKYGVRLNKNLLIDRSCAPIPIITGPKGNERQELFPWYFQPIIIPESNHPIVGNVDPILTDFVSSIDTVASPGVKKSVILTTSPYTRILRSPVRVSLNIVSINPDFGNSNSPNQPLAVLLEGEFSSNYKNRLPPEFYNDRLVAFKEKSDFNRMLVIADGDVVKNEVSPDGSQILPLGWDPIARRQVYGNKEFLVNATNYLMGDESLISVRSRSIKIRKLDDEKILQNRYFWQTLNISVPIIVILLFGFVQFIFRKRKYATSKNLKK